MPLLSLENSYNAQDFKERKERITKILEKSGNKNRKEISYQLEPKFDGISVELIYKD
ncbi:MAG: hypothetical protein GXP45_02900 [bacterium]|nr:hypothetical protein [bacterium]